MDRRCDQVEHHVDDVAHVRPAPFRGQAGDPAQGVLGELGAPGEQTLPLRDGGRQHRREVAAVLADLGAAAAKVRDEGLQEGGPALELVAGLEDVDGVVDGGADVLGATAQLGPQEHAAGDDGYGVQDDLVDVYGRPPCGGGERCLDGVSNVGAELGVNGGWGQFE